MSPLLRAAPLAVVLTSFAALAETEDSVDREVANKSLDPTSDQLDSDFEFKWTPAQTDAASPEGELKFLPKVPFYLWHQRNVLRVTVPYELDMDHSAAGHLGTVELLDVLIFPTDWGRWGVGPVVFIPTDKDPPEAGPAGGVVWRPGNWTFGVFTQTLFSDKVAETIFQPIFGYSVKDWLTIGSGNPKDTFDYKKGNFSALPVGAEVGFIVRPFAQHIRMAVDGEYDFAQAAAGNRWSVRFTLNFVVPTHDAIKRQDEKAKDTSVKGDGGA